MQIHHDYDQCIDELNLDRKIIHDCTTGTLGMILQLFAEKESVLVLDEIQGVPSVIFNGIINLAEAETALDTFCELVQSKLSKAIRD